jgi:16S rRNA (uracil1498-N3)-methyltransferase
MTRVYQNQTLKVNAEVQLDEQASHYLARVLRMAVGDKLTVFNGEGGEYDAVIQQINKKNIQVGITTFNAREVESPINVTLAQGLARGEKMDFIVQKAVELGVKHIVPLMTERCNVKLDGAREEKRVQHWQLVAISACEQSGRNFVPTISAPITLQSWLPQVKADKCFVLSPHVATKLPEEKLKSGANIMLLIGPEGGLSDTEVQAAITHGFLPLSLGPRILRTETAPLAAIAMLQTKHGDF